MFAFLYIIGIKKENTNDIEIEGDEVLTFRRIIIASILTAKRKE